MGRPNKYPEEWPARYPGMLPYPTGPISNAGRPVPNGSAVNWPQAQFAPRFLPPGSPSYQPFRYPDGSLTRKAPLYNPPVRMKLVNVGPSKPCPCKSKGYGSAYGGCGYTAGQYGCPECNGTCADAEVQQQFIPSETLPSTETVPASATATSAFTRGTVNQEKEGASVFVRVLGMAVLGVIAYAAYERATK